MSEWKTYDPWLEDLKDIAAIEGIDLVLDKYHYHTYFMRGLSVDVVISDIKELSRLAREASQDREGKV